MNQGEKPKNLWSERRGNELYVYHNGKLIYKRWYKRGSNEKSRSILMAHNGWPTHELPAKD